MRGFTSQDAASLGSRHGQISVRHAGTHRELVVRETAQIVREMRLEAACHKGCAVRNVSNVPAHSHLTGDRHPDQRTAQILKGRSCCSPRAASLPAN